MVGLGAWEATCAFNYHVIYLELFLIDNMYRTRWNGSVVAPSWDEVRAVELYNHTGDDGSDPDAYEIVNAAATAPRSLLDALRLRLRLAYGYGTGT